MEGVHDAVTPRPCTVEAVPCTAAMGLGSGVQAILFQPPGLQVLFEMLDGLEQQTRPIMEAGGCPDHPTAPTCIQSAPRAPQCAALH